MNCSDQYPSKEMAPMASGMVKMLELLKESLICGEFGVPVFQLCE
jgi:hypothetical protein